MRISTIPVRTRLPAVAWAIAGLASLYSVSSSFIFHVAPPASIAQQTANPIKQTQQANVLELLELFHAF
jgi:hypothetical protein